MDDPFPASGHCLNHIRYAYMSSTPRRPASTPDCNPAINGLVITDDGHRFALRSTRNHPRTALHPEDALLASTRRKQQQVSRSSGYERGGPP